MLTVFSNQFASRVLKTSRLSFFLTGAHGLILNGEDISTIEDIRKWTVDDVYNFIGSLPGCSDYAQVITNIHHVHSHILRPLGSSRFKGHQTNMLEVS